MNIKYKEIYGRIFQQVLASEIVKVSVSL